jgi:hypothetical protein
MHKEPFRMGRLFYYFWLYTMFVSRTPPKESFRFSELPTNKKIGITLFVVSVLVGLVGAAVLWGVLDPSCPLGAVGCAFKKAGAITLLTASTAGIIASLIFGCKGGDRATT